MWSLSGHDETTHKLLDCLITQHVCFMFHSYSCCFKFCLLVAAVKDLPQAHHRICMIIYKWSYDDQLVLVGLTILSAINVKYSSVFIAIWLGISFKVKHLLKLTFVLWGWVAAALNVSCIMFLLNRIHSLPLVHVDLKRADF